MGEEIRLTKEEIKKLKYRMKMKEKVEQEQKEIEEGERKRNKVIIDGFKRLVEEKE